jgi:hypothetical protein
MIAHIFKLHGPSGRIIDPDRVLDLGDRVEFLDARENSSADSAWADEETWLDRLFGAGAEERGRVIQ